MTKTINHGLIIIFISLLILTSIGEGITSTLIDTKNNIRNSENQHLSYTFSYQKPRLSSTKINDVKYTNIKIPGLLSNGKKIGAPALPVSFIKLVLPPKRQVKEITITGDPIEVFDSCFDLTASPILPYQRSVPIGKNKLAHEINLNTTIYQSNSRYPSSVHENQGIGFCRGYAILTLAINPVQYYPKTGRLFFTPNITVDINLEETTLFNRFYRDNSGDKAWVEDLVDNPEVLDSYDDSGLSATEYFGGLCQPDENYDYVIIVREKLYDFSGETYSWSDFIQRKQEAGLNATRVKVEDITACPDYWNLSNSRFNDTPALIREFCRDAYQDWGIQYVLVAGDQEDYEYPTYTMTNVKRRLLSYESEWGVESDLYWSNLDNTFNNDGDYYWGERYDSGGFDPYSELFIGSIPCDTGEDISNWMTKSFRYESTDDLDLLDNAAFYGGDTGWDCQGDDFIDYSAIKGTDDWLTPSGDPLHDGSYPEWLGFLHGFETWNKNYPFADFNLSVKWTAEPPNPGGWQGGDTYSATYGMKCDINANKCTLISAIAHADPWYSMDVWGYDWENDYYNTMPFLLLDMGCHCGDMDDAYDGVLHSMLFSSSWYLAFACVYNTGYGWGNFYNTNSSSSLQQKLFWDYLLDIKNNSDNPDNWQLGKAMAFSKDTMAPTLDWDPVDGTWRGTIESCLLFGDPALTIKIPDQSKLYSNKWVDGYIHKIFGPGSDLFDPKIYGDDSGEEISLQFHESGMTPVYYSVRRGYLCFNTEVLDDLTDKSVRLWIKMKRNGVLYDDARFRIYTGHDFLCYYGMHPMSYNCCNNYTGVEVDPTCFSTEYEWKCFEIPTELINLGGYTDFELKPNWNSDDPPTDPRWNAWRDEGTVDIMIASPFDDDAPFLEIVDTPIHTEWSYSTYDGWILKRFGHGWDDLFISNNTDEEVRLEFHESGMTPVLYYARRGYLSFNTAYVGDLTGKKVRLWIMMKRNGTIYDSARYRLYTDHDKIHMYLPTENYDCCQNYTGIEVNPSTYSTKYEWKCFDIPVACINPNGQTDFEFKPNWNNDNPPTDPRWNAWRDEGWVSMKWSETLFFEPYDYSDDPYLEIVDSMDF